VVECTTASRGEVPGGRKPVIGDDNDDNINNIHSTTSLQKKNSSTVDIAHDKENATM
jgi:hypothetical protein